MTDKQVTVGGNTIRRPVMRNVFIRTFDTSAAPTQEWLDSKFESLYAETGVRGAVFDSVFPTRIVKDLGDGGTSVSDGWRAVFTIWT